MRLLAYLTAYNRQQKHNFYYLISDMSPTCHQQLADRCRTTKRFQFKIQITEHLRRFWAKTGCDSPGISLCLDLSLFTTWIKILSFHVYNTTIANNELAVHARSAEANGIPSQRPSHALVNQSIFSYRQAIKQSFGKMIVINHSRNFSGPVTIRSIGPSIVLYSTTPKPAWVYLIS